MFLATSVDSCHCLLYSAEVGEYTLRELADAAGKKERTVRYYQQLGLLRQPGQIGAGAHYEDEDRLRLTLIGQLQDQGRSLTEIAAHFATLDETGLRDEALRHGSALDYVRSVLGEKPAAGTPVVSSSLPVPARLAASSSRQSPPPGPQPAAQWERIEVVPGIELHVRQPVSSARRRVIADYLARARRDLEGIN